ncbi:hypothetical protein LCGC14_1121820 [marine sediment metagenome]|uniref:Response regulator n=2 Tax=root TaxID=1 RepID=A0A831VP62_9FLAO|nr:response regulator [Pricia sp.]HEA22500.1 response regulator [Pricia antarctica]
MEIPILWLIDDDVICRYACNYKLEQSGKKFEIIGHSSAFEGLTSLAAFLHENKKLPDIILLDLNMPGMDGWSFIEEIEKMGDTVSKIQIYILTSFTNLNDRKIAQQHPLIKGFFRKPLSLANVEVIFSGIEIENVPETLI